MIDNVMLLLMCRYKERRVYYISRLLQRLLTAIGLHLHHRTILHRSRPTDPFLRLVIMRFKDILSGCLFTSIQCAPLPSPCNSLLSSLGLTNDETGATAFSLLYGSPLLAFVQTATAILNFGESNTLYNHNTTSTPATLTVVRPNVDTIYSEAIFDLTAADLVFKLPPMEEGRFYLAAFYDPSVFPSASYPL